MKIQRLKIYYILCLLLTIFTTLILWLSIKHKVTVPEYITINKEGSKTPNIPNIVHYIIFNENKINIITYLSILSVLKIQKPLSIIIHTNIINFHGEYWDKLHSINSNTSISISPLNQPTHVFGQLLSSVYHSSDVARIDILLKYGGIYFDTDVLVLKNLDPLRYYNMVVGLPEKEYMGTQVLLAAPSNPFLKLWLEGYKKYHPRDWYYNAGIVPTEIINNNPYICHCLKESLGVQNLLKELHSIQNWNWHDYYTLHLLSRHEPSLKNISEEIISKLNTNFGNIARWILSL